MPKPRMPSIYSKPIVRSPMQSMEFYLL